MHLVFTKPKRLMFAQLMLVVFIIACGSTVAEQIVVEIEVTKIVTKEVIVEKEVIKEVEVPVVVEKVVIKEVIKEIIVILSSEAGEHMGEEATVRGSVVNYNYNRGAKGRPYILIFDKPVTRRAIGEGAFRGLEVPESFKVVIFQDDQKNFPGNFAGAYPGHTVCATGMIVDYKGDPAIVAHDPSQLKIDC